MCFGVNKVKMRLEIPTLTRCCGCLPLRRGIITLGYLSLAFAVLFIFVQLQFEQELTEHTMAVYRGANFSAEKWLPILLYFIEITFILVLLVGAHMEKMALIRVYYYYGITTTAAALVVYFWTLMRGDQNFYMISHFRHFYFLIDVCTIFIGVVTQAYLLLLIRSQLQKPRESLHSLNHLAGVFVQPVQENHLSYN